MRQAQGEGGMRCVCMRASMCVHVCVPFRKPSPALKPPKNQEGGLQKRQKTLNPPAGLNDAPARPYNATAGAPRACNGPTLSLFCSSPCPAAPLTCRPAPHSNPV